MKQWGYITYRKWIDDYKYNINPGGLVVLTNRKGKTDTESDRGNFYPGPFPTYNF